MNRFILFLFVLFMVVPGINGQTTIRNGIVSHWNFNKDFNASIGRTSYNGTGSGGASVDAVVKRFDGASAKFVRSQSGYVAVGSSPFSQASHTYAAWYYLDIASITGSDRYSVIEATDNTNYPVSYGLRVGATGSPLVGQQIGQVFTHDNGATPTVMPSKDILSGSHQQWHHIAITFNSVTKSFQIYLDGTLVDNTMTLRINATTIRASTRMVIGGHRDYTGRNRQGWIDEMAVWNRVLTADEIAWLQSNPILQAVPVVTFDTPTYGQSQSLSWTELSTAANGYTIEISRNGGTWANYSETYSKTETSLTIPASEFEDPGTRQFRVRAKSTDNHLEGGWGESEIRSIIDPLPVELTSFNGVVSAQQVNLNWETATEINNYGFEIERDNGQGTIGNSAWEKIGFVNGNGNSNSTKQYSFEDDIKSILSHTLSAKLTLQYRLKQIDNDGNYEYSDIVEVEVNNIPAEFALYQNYPNPFNPSTIIKFALPVDSKVVLEVYNTLGEKVTELVNKDMAAGYHLVQLNGSGLASGTYFYILKSGKYMETKKMVLIR